MGTTASGNQVLWRSEVSFQALGLHLLEVFPVSLHAVYCRPACPQASCQCSVSAFQLPVARIGLQTYNTIPGFLHGFWGLMETNPGIHRFQLGCVYFVSYHLGYIRKGFSHKECVCVNLELMQRSYKPASYQNSAHRDFCNMVFRHRAKTLIQDPCPTNTARSRFAQHNFCAPLPWAIYLVKELISQAKTTDLEIVCWFHSYLHKD